MESYLAIERHRFGPDLHAKTLAEESALGLEVPVFLLQPLVENAIVHGFSGTQGHFQMEIRATRELSRLCLEVANTGVWKSGDEGVGLTNTRRRLALFYADQATLTLEHSNAWVRVKITLPIVSAS